MSEALLTRDLDYYKATMTQVEHAKFPETQVTFELINRANHQLAEFVPVEELEAALEAKRTGWKPEEVAALAGHLAQDGSARFSPEYLDYLLDNDLPEVSATLDEGGELVVSTTGPAPLVSFWETCVMSTINEIYYLNYLADEGLSLQQVEQYGDELLSEKIALLRARPDIKFADFGTRRRFSYDWHEHVVQRLAAELPDNFLGTSNIYMAEVLGLKPIGTFAHEMPMVYGAMEENAGGNPLDGHDKMLRDWQTFYNGDLSTALTDTYTSEFFFESLTPEQARQWKGLRHDSGDPIEFGEKAIAFYEIHGIDPAEKFVLFSDGLDIPTMIRLADYFAGRIPILFGIGTDLSNDVGLRRNNFVMKATRVDGRGTVKLSDVEGKHTGEAADVERYIDYVTSYIGQRALAGASV